MSTQGSTGEHEPALVRPRSAPDRVDGHRSPFVGRADLLDRLRATVTAAQQGRLAGVVLGGPAGIGKTRLVDELVAGLPAGTPVLRGAGRHEGPGAVAPVAAGELWSTVTDAFLPAPSTAPAPVSDRPAPDRPAPDRPAPDRPAAGRESAFRAVGDVLARAAEDAGLLALVLEDLQWADETSLELLPVLVRRLAGSPVVLVATHRDGHETTRPLRHLLVALDRAHAVSRLQVGPLTSDEVGELVTRATGRRLPPDQVDDVVRRCGGVTLFLEELLPVVARGDDAVLPTSLTQHLTAVLDRLGAGARDLVDQVAVLGGHVGLELLAAASELSHAQLEKQLDELLEAGVLVVDDAGTGYRFRHDLLHEAVLAVLRPTVRRRLHVHAADVLTAHPGLTPAGVPVAAELARHRQGAGDGARELVARIAAADEAVASRAYPEALGHRQRALELLGALRGDEPRPVDPVTLLRAAADDADLSGEHGTAADLLARAVDAVSDPTLLAELQARRVGALWLSGDQAGAARTAMAAVATLGPDVDPAPRARLLALSAFAWLDPAVPGTPLTATTQALALAETADDAGCLCTVLCGHALALVASGRPDEAREALARAEALSGLVDDPRTAMRPAVYRMLLLRHAGEVRGVVAVGREAVLRADRLGVSRGVGQQVRGVMADAMLALGLWDDADEVVDDGLVWGGRSAGGAMLLMVAADLAVRRGRLDDAAAVLDELRGVAPGHPRLPLLESALAWARGDVDGSRFHACRGLELVTPTVGFEEVGPLAHALARAVAAAPDAVAAHERARLDAALAVTAAATTGPVHAWRASALAELAVGAAAEQAWTAAGELWRALAHEPMVALAARRAEEARGQGRPAPLDGVVEQRRPVDEGLVLALTGREREVLELLSRGWTNRRIAAELSISVRTVGTHVSRVLAKLGASTRGEAAAMAHQLR